MEYLRGSGRIKHVYNGFGIIGVRVEEPLTEKREQDCSKANAEYWSKPNPNSVIKA
jgi:hypothetical protein